MTKLSTFLFACDDCVAQKTLTNSNTWMLANIKKTLSDSPQFLYDEPETTPADKDGFAKMWESMGAHDRKRYVHHEALRRLYAKFDPKLYRRQGEPNDVRRMITAIWLEVRAEVKPFTDAHRSLLRNEARAQKKRFWEAVKVNKQTKLNEEYDRLGGGDRDKGRDLFNKRMKEQVAVAHSRRRDDVSVKQLERFRDWLKSPEAQKYYTPLVEAPYKSMAVRRRDSGYKTITLRIPQGEMSKYLLRILSNCGWSVSDLVVTLHSDFDNDLKYGCVFKDDSTQGFLKIHSAAKVSNVKVTVQCYTEVNSNLYISDSSKISGVYRLLPIEFKKLEDENPHKRYGATLMKYYNCANATWATVRLRRGSTRVNLNLQAVSRGDTVRIGDVFPEINRRTKPQVESDVDRIERRLAEKRGGKKSIESGIAELGLL